MIPLVTQFKRFGDSIGYTRFGWLFCGIMFILEQDYKTMKRSYTIIIFTLIPIMLTTFIAYWLYNNFERVAQKVEIGFQGEARDNPLLAAERLLKRMGTPVKIGHTLPKIKQLESQDTLILLEYGSFLKSTQTKQLLNWVRNGGHLIWVSDVLNNVQEKAIAPDPLFKRLSIRQYQNDLNGFEVAQILPTKFVWAQYHLQVAFDSDYHLKSPLPATKIGNKYGIHLLFHYFGNGMISVLSDMWFIENNRIDLFDHAKFLWLLVNSERSATNVWLVYTKTYNDDINIPSSKNAMPPLWNLLWTNMWAIIISVMILLLFWLWAASRRFGPLLPVPPRIRRRLLEHIEASGHFWWRQDRALMLLRGAKQALLKRLESVHPDWIRLSNTELSQRLALVSGLNAQEIENAWHCTKPDNEITFTQTVQIFTKIRKFL